MAPAQRVGVGPGCLRQLLVIAGAAGRAAPPPRPASCQRLPAPSSRDRLVAGRPSWRSGHPSARGAAARRRGGAAARRLSHLPPAPCTRSRVTRRRPPELLARGQPAAPGAPGEPSPAALAALGRTPRPTAPFSPGPPVQRLGEYLAGRARCSLSHRGRAAGPCLRTRGSTAMSLRTHRDTAPGPGPRGTRAAGVRRLWAVGDGRWPISADRRKRCSPLRGPLRRRR